MKSLSEHTGTPGGIRVMARLDELATCSADALLSEENR